MKPLSNLFLAKNNTIILYFFHYFIWVIFLYFFCLQMIEEVWSNVTPVSLNYTCNLCVCACVFYLDLSVSPSKRRVPQQPWDCPSWHRLQRSCLPTHWNGFSHEWWYSKYDRNTHSGSLRVSKSVNKWLHLLNIHFMRCRCPQPQLTTLDDDYGNTEQVVNRIHSICGELDEFPVA